MMTMSTIWEQAQAASYQAAQNPNYNPNYGSINTQNPIPFPGAWQGDKTPFVIGPQEVWVLTRYDEVFEDTVVVGVFRVESEADKVGNDSNFVEWHVNKFYMNSEVVVDEPKE